MSSVQIETAAQSFAKAVRRLIARVNELRRSANKSVKQVNCKKYFTKIF